MTEKIEKILTGKASAQERIRFFRRLEQDPELADLYAKAKSEHLFMDQKNMLYENIESEIRQKKRKRRSRICRIVTDIAAVLAIPLAVYFIYDLSSGNSGNTEVSTTLTELMQLPTTIESALSYETHTGIVGEVLLPDSSIVYLNSDSRIEFPAVFDDRIREINFMGEGYFKIRKDPGRPMKINSGNGISVCVTGTEFNLNHYCGSDRFRLALLDGSLFVYHGKDSSVISLQEKEEVTILQDEEAVSVSNLSEDAEECITSWIHGRLIFKNTPMTEVTSRLGRWYGYNIMIFNPEIKKYRFTGNFKSESLTDVMETIKISSDIRYSVTNRDVVLY